MNGSNASSDAPIIGIRDSGVGGLTVAREVKKLLPHAQILYFADTAHVPYGDRSPQEVRFFALSISQWLLEKGAQTLVFACNTTSAYALPQAREQFSVPVIGMIEPGAREALNQTRNGRIGILATQATVDSGVYSQTIHDLDATGLASTCEVACPRFVLLVESQQSESPDAFDAACKYLQPLLQSGCDTAILGCTHYPLLLPILQRAAPQMKFIDPARFVARELQQLLSESSPSTNAANENEDIFYVSGESDGVRFWVEALLDNSRPRLEIGPIFERATATSPAR